MNPFESQPNKKRKRTIIGERFQKGSEYRNQKKVTVENVKRNLSLLSELRREGRRGRFLDNRLGEKLKNLSEYQKAARRVESLRTRRAAAVHNSIGPKNRSFVLSDKDQFDLGHHLGEEGQSDELVITHRGKPIVELSDQGLTMTSEDELDDFLDNDASDSVPVDMHFGGDQYDTPGRTPKSRKEVYQEIITKSKAAKAQRSAEKDYQEDRLEKLDAAFKELHGVLNFRPTKWSPEWITTTAEQECRVDQTEESNAYDKLSKSLVFDNRTHPTDRVKTAQELAMERTSKLEALEKARQEFEDGLITRQQETDSEGNVSDDQSELSSSDNELEDEKRDDDATVREAHDLMNESSLFQDHTSDSNLTDPEKVAREQREMWDLHSEDAAGLGSDEMDQPERMEDGSENFDRVKEVETGKEVNIENNRDHDLPSWAINDEDEGHLKFMMPFPKSLKEFKQLLGKEKARSQWKLLHRLRAATDPSLNHNNGSRRSQLLRGILEYLEAKLIDEIRVKRLGREIKKDNEILGECAFELIELLQEHVVDLAKDDVVTIRDFMIPRLITTSIQMSSDVLQKLNKMKLFHKWKSETGYEIPLNIDNNGLHFSNRPTNADLALVFLIAIISPRCVVDGRIFVAPALLLLDTWSIDLCQMHKTDFTPVDKSGLSPRQDHHPIQSSDGFSTLSKNGHILLPEVSTDQIPLAFILLGLQLIFIESAHCYSSTVLPLACGLLRSVVCFAHSTRSANNIENIQSLQRSIAELLDSIKLVLFVIKSVTAVDVHDILLVNVVIPMTTVLLSGQLHELGIQELIETFHHEMVKLVFQPLLPLHLAPTRPQGIRMLTPKYADPKQLSGARYLRLRGATEEQVALRKLSREVHDARRGASRQLRRDAEFVGAVMAREKRKRDEKLEQGYKRFVKILNQDVEELHKMKTSGGGMDTSIKVFAARKKLKKQNKRLGGDRTSHT